MKQFLTGFLCGAVVALLVAAGGALFVTESPVPFMSKVQSSSTEYVQDALKGGRRGAAARAQGTGRRTGAGPG